MQIFEKNFSALFSAPVEVVRDVRLAVAVAVEIHAVPFRVDEDVVHASPTA